MTGTPAPAATDLPARLSTLTYVDERRLRRRLRGARRIAEQGKRDRAVADVERQVGAAEAKVARRRAAVPIVRYPPELPVSDRVDDLAAAIAENQVVIVAGETGSGKVHPAAEDLPADRPWGPRHHRAHPAAADRGQGAGRADRRGDRHDRRRGGRLRHPVRRPHRAEHPGQADD